MRIGQVGAADHDEVHLLFGDERRVDAPGRSAPLVRVFKDVCIDYFQRAPIAR
jgi:hypothetical protein